MNIIILYDKNYIIDKLEKNNTIYELKKKIKKKINLNIERQSLYFSGFLLNNEKKLSDYNIHNNSIIFLSEILEGGNVPGFPNIGHLILLIGISSLFLLILYLFFYNIISIINNIKKYELCQNLSKIEAQLNQENINNNFFNILQNKFLIKKSGGGYSNWKDLFYNLSSMFYSSIIVILLTIYVYTMNCNNKLSDWLVILSLGSFFILFFIFYFSYKLVKNNIITSLYATKIITLSFIIISFSLLLSSFIIPILSKTNYMHWTTYIYPIGVIITVTLNYMINSRTNWSIYIKIISFLIISILFIIIPYTMAYIYNIHQYCS
jgi:hypothetical protein